MLKPASILELLACSRVVREPPAEQPGYWAGAPGSYFAPRENAWYLTYRLRRPRGVLPDRGGEARIARSTDLETWQDLWQVTKDQFSSASIERCALAQGSDGFWRYFASYVDPADGRWCVSVVQAREIQKLDPARAKPLFKGAALGLEGIKDPWLLSERGTFYLFLSVALPTALTDGGSHSSLDIFNTGQCLSATALATSTDLDSWQWHGIIFSPTGAEWDGYCRRINSVLPWQGRYLAFYDGSASHAENYEEKTGLAVSTDLRHWSSVTPDAPLWTSPHASGSLRYLDARLCGQDVSLCFECARTGGSHDLRLLKTPLDALISALPLSSGMQPA